MQTLLNSFAVTGSAVMQISVLALLGYILVKRRVLGGSCLLTLSNLTLDVCLPALILYQLIMRFSPQEYPQWWLLPLLSFAVTAAGVVVGALCSLGVKGEKEKRQCISLVGFQNSGYLPLALIGSLVPQAQAGILLIYLFLFLAGFNFAMFSLGVYLLNHTSSRKLDVWNYFNPPVLATVCGVGLVLTGISRFVPHDVMLPMHALGECTLPLAMLVVGGSLAEISIKKMDVRSTAFAVFGKMVLLPLLALAAVVLVKLPEPLGLTIILQAAAPSAISLSAILKKYDQPDLVVSHGIFISHLAAIVTLPVILSVYFAFAVVK